MFTPIETYSIANLTKELVTDPEYLGYAALIDGENDPIEIANLLKTVTTSTLIPMPISDLYVWLGGGSRLSKLKAAQEDTTEIPGVGDVSSIATIGMMLLTTDKVYDLDLDKPQIIGMMQALVAVGVFSEEDLAALIELATQPVTRQEQLWGYGIQVSTKDIELAIAGTPEGMAVLSNQRADDTIVGYYYAQEQDLHTHQVNKTRYETMLLSLEDSAFRDRILHLFNETEQRITEVTAIIASTQSQLPSQRRVDAALARLREAGVII